LKVTYPSGAEGLRRKHLKIIPAEALSSIDNYEVKGDKVIENPQAKKVLTELVKVNPDMKHLIK
jgi:hypothetical protein